jgi:hypothetical protein
MKALWVSVCILAATVSCGAQTVSTFTLKKIDGNLSHFKPGDAPATAIVFISAQCPMSVDYSERLSKLGADYAAKGVRFLLVNSNVNESDEEVEKQRSAAGVTLPVYRDPAGQIAAMLGAVATPTAVVIDRNGQIRYFGMIDNSRNPARVTKQVLRMALDSVIAGAPVEVSRTRVIGCTIKNAGLPQ